MHIQTCRNSEYWPTLWTASIESKLIMHLPQKDFTFNTVVDPSVLACKKIEWQVLSRIRV